MACAHRRRFAQLRWPGRLTRLAAMLPRRADAVTPAERQTADVVLTRGGQDRTIERRTVCPPPSARGLRCAAGDGSAHGGANA